MKEISYAIKISLRAALPLMERDQIVQLRQLSIPDPTSSIRLHFWHEGQVNLMVRELSRSIDRDILIAVMKMSKPAKNIPKTYDQRRKYHRRRH